MRHIRILEEAATEAVEAAAWYESERPGLGVEFMEAIDAALDLLEKEQSVFSSSDSLTILSFMRLRTI